MGVVYKIKTKVLARRIKSILPTIIDDSQSIFLKDRCLLDSVLVTNEVVEDLRRYNRSGVCLKVDYEKTYNSVKWDFFIRYVKQVGLSQ